MSVNRVHLIGNLGKDPELQDVSGTALCKFSLATTRRWTKNGEKKEETSWHQISAWGKQAEVMNQYLSKGSQVYIEGRVQYSQSEKDGVTRYFTNIIVESFQFIGKKGDSGQTELGVGGQRQSRVESTDDDLPF